MCQLFIKHTSNTGRLLKEKQNTVIKTSVLNEISHCMLTDNETVVYDCE